MKRVALVGDTHKDESSRSNEHDSIMHWIGKDAAQRGVDLFLHSGDVWERRSTSRERIDVADYWRQWTEHAPGVVVGGNHDDMLDIEWIGRLRTKHPLHAMTRPGLVSVAGCQVACLPWPRKAHMLAQIGNVSREESDKLAVEHLRNILRGLGQSFDATGPRLFLGHVQMRGSRISVSQPPLTGCDFELGLDDLRPVGAQFYALGHIHMGEGNEWDIDGAPAAFPGSPRRCNYGETEPKGYIIIEFNDAGELSGWERVATPATPMLHLEGQWDEVENTLRVEWDESAVQGAEIRLRFSVPKDRSSHAWSLAQDYKRAILECGAQSVKVEAVPVVVKRARAPEVAKALSMDEKVAAHWKSVDFDPGDRREPLLRKVRQLDEAVGTSSTAPTWLRLHRAHLHGIGPHKDFSLDLDQYPGQPIIALVGENGDGKTTLIESAIGGACHRKMPTQGTLVSRAVDRDSWLESCITSGDRTFTIRHTVDAVSGKSEALVLNEQGDPEYSGASVRAFDKWSTQHLPDPSVLFSTQFAAQPASKTRPRFIDLDSSERISVILKAIGVERLEHMAEAARKHRDAAAIELEKAETRLADERERVGDIDELRAELDRREAAAKIFDQQLAEARAELQKAEGEAREIAAEAEKLSERRAARYKLQRDIEEAKKQRDGLDARVKELAAKLEGRERDQELVSELDARREALAEGKAAWQRELEVVRQNNEVIQRIRKLSVQSVELDNEITKLEARKATTEKLLAIADEVREAVEKKRKLDEASADLVEERQQEREAQSKASAELATASEKLDALRREEARLLEALEDSDAVDDAVSLLPRLRTELEQAQANRDSAASRLEELQGRTLAGAEERIGNLRDGLELIVRDSTEANERAQETLDADDEAVEAAKRVPHEIATAKASLREARECVESVRRRFEETDRLAAKKPEQDKSREDLNRVIINRSMLEVDVEAYKDRVEKANAKLQSLSARSAELVDEERQVQALANQLSSLEAAEAVAGELEPQIESARKRRDEDKAEAEAENEKLQPEGTENLPDFDELAKRATEAEEAAAREVERDKAQAILAEVEPQAHKAQAEVMRLEMELLDFADVDEPRKPTHNIEECRKSVALAEQTSREAHQAAAVARANLDAARERSGKLSAICQERDRVAAELADWTRLSADLGRKGIQSAEVDSAGELLTELCNDILRACHGPRYTITIDTSRLSADGKKSLDECLVMVIDSEKGTEKDAKLSSGGERVFLGEAIEAAILVLSCIKADAQNPTIVRDESMPALSQKNMRVYFQMLRYVIEKTRAAHLILVSHSVEFQKMCDVRIPIGGGSAEPVEGVREEAAA